MRIPNDKLDHGITRRILVWCLFFLICFGLGYQSVARYDPRALAAIYDTKAYYGLVVGAIGPEFSEYSHRLLVPYVAKPFYLLARGRIGTWDPVFFGLLVSNSLFYATAALLMVDIGYAVLGNYTTALLGSMLYMLNFAAVNFHLAGLVDSAQAFLMTAIIRTLFAQRWHWLPLWGFIAAFTKETSVPLGVTFALGWWLSESVERGFRRSKFFWILAMGMAGSVTLTVLMSKVSVYSPWTFAASQKGDAGFFTGALRCFLNHNFVYVFAWLLPLGLPRLRVFSRHWIAGSVAGVMASVAMGAYSDAAGNSVRPMFNVLGPLLTLSTATLLTCQQVSKGSRPARNDAREHSLATEATELCAFRSEVSP